MRNFIQYNSFLKDPIHSDCTESDKEQVSSQQSTLLLINCKHYTLHCNDACTSKLMEAVSLKNSITQYIRG